MFEAVGREYWDGYFQLLQRSSSPAAACIQTITIRDDLFERYVRSTDFIQQYIFPGGLLPSCAAFRARRNAPGWKSSVNELAFGADYAETLRRWRVQFLTQEARCASSASTPASCASGSSTWPIARPPLPPATPTSCSSRCAGPEACCCAADRPAGPPAAVMAAAVARAQQAAPAEVAAEWPQARQLGSGRLRFMGLRVYDARLWAPGPLGADDWAARPFALELVYARRCRAHRSPSARSPRCVARPVRRPHGGTLAGRDDGRLPRREGRRPPDRPAPPGRAHASSTTARRRPNGATPCSRASSSASGWRRRPRTPPCARPCSVAALELTRGAPTMTAAPRPGWQGGWRDGIAYGLMGLPLAFVALPLYVQLPNHYATAFGVPLARWARCCWVRGCWTRWPTP
jgi:hypothetical protein